MLLPLVVLATAGGCTSALSTAALRDALWEVSDHAAEEATQVADGDSAAGAADSSADPTATAVGGEADAERREAAIDEAVARLSRAGHLDAAAKLALVETLQQTAQEDWPVVVDTFAESLETTTASRAELAAEAAALVDEAAAASEPQSDAGVARQAAPTSSDVVAPEPPAEVTAAAEPPAPPAPLPPAPAPSASAERIGIEPLPTGPAAEPQATTEPAGGASAAFAVRHACFAKRVQGWGVVDRFPESRFAAGQDVIVYVELDNLSAGESPAGHTTCVAATLQLVDAEGRMVHEWTFEPIVETCPTRRHDYFARYVIRIPDAAPLGGCRLSIRAVDTLAGRTAATDLPLEVVSRQVAAR